MVSDRIIFPSMGVLLDPVGTPTATAIRWASYNQDSKVVKVKHSSGKIEQFEVTRVTQSPNTDRIEFVSNDVSYRIRELRDEDGIWLSQFATPLPSSVLEDYILKGDRMIQESLTAYALEDSPYVVGLVYIGTAGSYVRKDGDWLLLSPNDTTFTASNMLGIDINPSKANEFIELYDANFVSVSDLDMYESAGSDSSEQSDD